MSGCRIFGDWGGTRLRLWRECDGDIKDAYLGPGILELTSAPADVLRAALANWSKDGSPQRITLCGMAGAKGGLFEAPYADCPLPASRWAACGAHLELDRIPVQIAAGVSTPAGLRPDVMRGEEAQVFGAMCINPALASGQHVFVLPGTHSKWVWTRDGRIEDFRTFVTGELFALLQNSSLCSGAPEGERDDQVQGYLAGLDDAQRSSGTLGTLFKARATLLRCAKSLTWSRGFLLGSANWR